MTRIEIHSKIHFYLALIVAFTLPFARLTPIFIALLLANWLIEGDFRNKVMLLFKNKMALLFISFYSLFLVGMTYTEHLNAGWFDLQVKCSLFLFPVILVTRPFTEKHKESILFSFIGGGIIASIFLLLRATYLYNTVGDLDHFLYTWFSFLMHPSYFSMYLNVGLAWLFLWFLQNKFTQFRSSKTYLILVILLFSIVIVLLSSKIGWIILALTQFTFWIYFTFIRKRHLSGLIGIFSITIAMYFIFNLLPKIGGRMDRAVTAVSSNKESSSEKTESESTAVRILIWKASVKVVSENFLFGVGTGDTKDVLIKEYKKQGIKDAIKYQLNTHNQFLQVFVGIGIIGFLLFITTLIVPLVKSLQPLNPVYIVFLLIIILNFLPESMLETQAGVMFYAFFNSLLCFNQK